MPGRDGNRALPEHQSQHVSRARAQGHPDPQLAPALIHQVSQHAVDSDGREYGGDRGEYRHQLDGKALPRERVRQNLVHRKKRYRQIRVERGHFVTQRGYQCHATDFQFDDQADPQERDFRTRVINSRPGRSGRAAGFGGAHEANDGVGRPWDRERDLHADRVHVRKKSPCDGFIDDRRGRRALLIGRQKIAAAQQRNTGGFEIAGRSARLPDDLRRLIRIARMSGDLNGASGPAVVRE